MYSGDFTDGTNAEKGGASFSPPGVLASSATWTFLFTDIAGSTRLWDGAGGGAVASDETRASAVRPAIVRHETILRGWIESCGGHFFKSVGDGVCAAFVSPRAALNAAVAAQKALLAEFGGEASDNLPASASIVFRVRIALYTGEAEMFDNDYRGSALSRVTRLLDLLHGGQIAVSETTAALLRRDSGLPPGVSLRDLGEHRLRDLTCAERVFQVGAEGLPRDFPALRSLSVQPNNLPVQLTAFLGRDRELADVSGLLRTSGAGAVRLLTLTGAGGAGKTRLSLQAAAAVLPEFGGGAFFVDLAPISGDRLVLPAIAAAVGGGSGGGATPPTSECDLITWLNERRAVAPGATANADAANAVLVVLDNCEHLVDECARIADRLLRACPGLRILATSREPLGVAGETAWAVPPLPLPEPGRSYTLRHLAQFTAVALFAERARSVRSDFVLTDANAPHVTAICRRLDGIPFALELAAAWVSTLSPSQIESRLSDRFRLLSGGAGASNRTALPRQQTLRATIDWSYALLTEAERILLRRLSVFAGGWTLAAAEAVCADDENETSGAKEADALLDVLPALGALVRKSLVVCDEACGDDNENRYRLLETIREYGGERLRVVGETNAVRRRHLAHFAAWASDNAAHCRGDEQAAWLARFGREHDNVRAALAWGTDASSSAGATVCSDDCLHALQLAGAMLWFWRVRGHGGEGRDWLLRALDALPKPSAEQREKQRAARIKALNGLGIFASDACNFDQANEFFSNALLLCEEDTAAKTAHAGDAANLRANLGNVAGQRGDFDEAEKFLSESLRYYQTNHDDARSAMLLNNLATVAADRGRPDDAIRRMSEGIAIERRLKDQLSLATSLGSLTDALRARNEPGDHARAWEATQEGLVLRLALGDRFGLAPPLMTIGLLLLDAGQTYQAAQAFGSAASASNAATTTATLDVSHEERLRNATAQARAELGARAFAFAYDEGCRLKPEAWIHSSPATTSSSRAH